MPACTACSAAVDDEPFAKHREPLFGREFGLHRCPRCGVTFSVIPPDFPLADWYRKADHLYSETAWMIHVPVARDWRFNTFFRLRRELGLKGELLDVGCGDGRFLTRAKREGWEGGLHGVEFNPNMAGRRQTEFDLELAPIPEFLARHPTPAYDVVTIFDVLEHLAEPGQAMRGLVGLLKPGGYLVITLPNEDRLRLFEREMWDFPPNHNTRWTAAALRGLAERHGLAVVGVYLSPGGARTFSDQLFYPAFRGAVRLAKRLLYGRKADSGKTLTELLKEDRSGVKGAIAEPATRRKIELWLSRAAGWVTLPVFGPLALALRLLAPRKAGGTQLLIARKPR